MPRTESGFANWETEETVDHILNDEPTYQAVTHKVRELIEDAYDTQGGYDLGAAHDQILDWMLYQRAGMLDEEQWLPQPQSEPVQWDEVVEYFIDDAMEAIDPV